MNRNAILIERDKKMFDKMVERFHTTNTTYDSLFED